MCVEKGKHELHFEKENQGEKPIDGSIKRSRTVFSVEQVSKLEATFKVTNFLSRIQKIELAKALNLRGSVIKVWFQNRRMKEKRLKAENESSCGEDVSPIASSSHPMQSTYQKHPYLLASKMGYHRMISYPYPYYDSLCGLHNRSLEYLRPFRNSGPYHAAGQQPHLAVPYDLDYTLRSYTEAHHLNPELSSRSPVIQCEPRLIYQGMHFYPDEDPASNRNHAAQEVNNFYHVQHLDYRQDQTSLMIPCATGYGISTSIAKQSLTESTRLSCLDCYSNKSSCWVEHTGEEKNSSSSNYTNRSNADASYSSESTMSDLDNSANNLVSDAFDNSANNLASDAFDNSANNLASDAFGETQKKIIPVNSSVKQSEKFEEMQEENSKKTVIFRPYI